MRRLWTLLALGVVAASLAIWGGRMAADEGMWTFDNPPFKQLKERYNFVPTQAWLDHLRLSSVRFNDGGSGSFVSPDGLVLTNHHVALAQLQKLSSAEHNYVEQVFYARTPAEELKCPDLELNVLRSMENVTSRVLAAVKPGMTDDQAYKARRAEIAKIEKESLDATGLRSDVIPLYQDSEYWLYRYKKYTDVRLVFAPTQQTAYFGGDPDNFTYPRYDLDFALFRVYENGKPVDSSKDYLKWDPKGPADGDLVFVSGNPGSTSRLDTLAQLQFTRDESAPLILSLLKDRLQALTDYSKEGAEQTREAASEIFFINNSIKAYTGIEKGLRNPELMAQKQKQQEEFRARLAQNPQLEKEYGGAWDQISKAMQNDKRIFKPYVFRRMPVAALASRAVTMVEYVQEVKKPDGERLPGFHDSQLASLRFQLFSPAPVYLPMQQALLTSALKGALQELGPDDPFVKAALEGKTPEEAAAAALDGTKLGDAAFRKSLIEGGESAVANSTDPLIEFARRVEPSIREIIKQHQDEIESIQSHAGQMIGKARFAVYGKNTYPDATFTLRLAFGTVKGYPMNGTIAPAHTTFYGLYDRAYSFDLKPPFNLTPPVMAARDKIDLTTPVDFVSTCDIIGGNSGSPVVNRQGELVGLIFDGNIESLVSDFMYDEEYSRAVAVDSAAIITALRKIYNAGALANELEGKSASSGM